MHCVTQAPRPLLCPDLDKWPPRDDDGPPRIGLSGDGTGVRRTNYAMTCAHTRRHRDLDRGRRTRLPADPLTDSDSET